MFVYYLNSGLWRIDLSKWMYLSLLCWSKTDAMNIFAQSARLISIPIQSARRRQHSLPFTIQNARISRGIRIWPAMTEIKNQQPSELSQRRKIAKHLGNGQKNRKHSIPMNWYDSEANTTSFYGDYLKTLLFQVQINRSVKTNLFRNLKETAHPQWSRAAPKWAPIRKRSLSVYLW